MEIRSRQIEPILKLECESNGKECKRKDCSLWLSSVPLQSRNEKYPCHHISLNSHGETIDSIRKTGDMKRLEQTVLDWLKNLPEEEKNMAWDSGIITLFLHELQPWHGEEIEQLFQKN